MAYRQYPMHPYYLQQHPQGRYSRMVTFKWIHRQYETMFTVQITEGENLLHKFNDFVYYHYHISRIVLSIERADRCLFNEQTALCFPITVCYESQLWDELARAHARGIPYIRVETQWSCLIGDPRDVMLNTPDYMQLHNIYDNIPMHMRPPAAPTRPVAPPVTYTHPWSRLYPHSRTLLYFPTGRIDPIIVCADRHIPGVLNANHVYPQHPHNAVNHSPYWSWPP